MRAINTMGASRASHVAAIAMAGASWSGYADMHAPMFEKNKQDKFVLVNAEGGVIAKASKSAELVANALHTNATTLRHEDFLVIQEMITQVRRRSLNGIADLEAAGLSFTVGLEEQLVGVENINEFQDALQQMNPTDYQNNDTVFSEMYTPNPVTHQSYGIPRRQSGFDYKRSAGLNECIRQVSERLEKTLFNGNDEIKVSFGGASQGIYGYTNHPDRGTATISDWSNVANNDLIVNEVIAAIGKMFSDQGGVGENSVCMYFPKNFKSALDRDYVSGFPSKTVRQRIEDITEIKAVKFGEKLADSNVVFVELSDRTVQLAKASDIVSVPHTKTNPMEDQVVTIYAAMVQIIKVDANGNTGILHATV
jgi:hypothetical protein